MVLNVIWVGFFLVAFAVALARLLFLGDMEVFPALVNATFDASKAAFRPVTGRPSSGGTDAAQRLVQLPRWGNRVVRRHAVMQPRVLVLQHHTMLDGPTLVGLAGEDHATSARRAVCFLEDVQPFVCRFHCVLPPIIVPLIVPFGPVFIIYPLGTFANTLFSKAIDFFVPFGYNKCHVKRRC